MEQTPFSSATFGSNDFAENPEPRVPCVLLLDVSGSMAGNPIKELNDGLTLYKDEVMADGLAAKRVEIAIVTFGGAVETKVCFTTAPGFVPPTLEASGATPMGEAILRGVEMVTARKAEYRANGISFYRPWIFMITDGGPTDEWQSAATKVREGETAKNFAFFAVGTDGANFDTLSKISPREPLHLKGLRFRDLFKWLSNSQSSVSRSTPGQDVPLVNPTGPEGWASV